MATLIVVAAFPETGARGEILLSSCLNSFLFGPPSLRTVLSFFFFFFFDDDGALRFRYAHGFADL
jgi:hypothetical protein